MTYTPNIVQPIDQNAYHFSEELMQLISKIYSSNKEEANDSFWGLIDYFKRGSATNEEHEFLVMNNDNPIVELLNALRCSNLEEPYELLRQTVEQVVVRLQCRRT